MNPPGLACHLVLLKNYPPTRPRLLQAGTTFSARWRSEKGGRKRRQSYQGMEVLLQAIFFFPFLFFASSCQNHSAVAWCGFVISSSTSPLVFLFLDNLLQLKGAIWHTPTVLVVKVTGVKFVLIRLSCMPNLKFISRLNAWENFNIYLWLCSMLLWIRYCFQIFKECNHFHPS